MGVREKQQGLWLDPGESLTEERTHTAMLPTPFTQLGKVNPVFCIWTVESFKKRTGTKKKKKMGEGTSIKGRKKDRECEDKFSFAPLKQKKQTSWQVAHPLSL